MVYRNFFPFIVTNEQLVVNIIFNGEDVTVKKEILNLKQKENLLKSISQRVINLLCYG